MEGCRRSSQRVGRCHHLDLVASDGQVFRLHPSLAEYSMLANERCNGLRKPLQPSSQSVSAVGRHHDFELVGGAGLGSRCVHAFSTVCSARGPFR